MKLRRPGFDRWSLFGFAIVAIVLLALGVLAWQLLVTANLPLNAARSRVPRRVADIAEVADNIARLSPTEGEQVILYLTAIHKDQARDQFSPATRGLGDIILWMNPEQWTAVVDAIASRHSQRYRQARRQEEATKAIGQARGWTYYECETHKSHYWRDRWRPPPPEWLWRDWTGLNLLSAPYEVVFPVEHQIADPDSVLANVEEFTRLDALVLASSPVTDVGFAHVKGLTALTVLNIPGTRVTDAGLVHLQRLTRLKFLHLADTQVTDAGLVYVGKLRNLETLYLSDTRITDAGLEQLKGLSQLQELDLRRTQVTDAGVQKLQRVLPNCKIDR
jgi:hypothetical protein